jgi:two-component system sensor histidine kinase KdpD
MARGRLRVYLGAAPGVGKTFAMLNEGKRRLTRGTDVVVGFVETHGRPNTAAQLEGLEVLPRERIAYAGTSFEEMDLDALLARKPEVALVDELAHSNIPGSRHEKRWEDVEELLEAGIDVISTVNVQHLESMNDVVQQITGIEQRETIPDEVVRRAEQIELVDMTPEALRRRMAHGNIYKPEKVDTALANYFRVGNLGALRELALMWLADRVDEALEAYREAHGISGTWETRERVIVAITGAPDGASVVRRAARMSMRARGDLLGVHVRPADGLTSAPTERLAAHRQLLLELGGTYHEIAGADVAESLLRFTRAENGTQLVMGASRQSRWTELTRGSVINRVIRQSGAIDVHVISSAEPEPDEPRAPSRARRSALPRRRIVAAWLLALLGPLLLTLALAQVRHAISLPADLLLFLLLVVLVAVVGGLAPAVVAALAGSLLANWYFTPPMYTFTISEGENLLALGIFVLVGTIVSVLVAVSARRSAEAARARAEAETLAALGGTLAAERDPLPMLVAQLRTAFDVDAVAVLHKSADGGWTTEAVAGAPVPARPEDASTSLPLGETDVLAVTGDVRDEDLDVLQSFASQLRVATETRRLRSEAALAGDLAEANTLRTALLAAVSHDLRTPLASIKASVSSLLQRDVTWTPDATRDFLETIDEETDRLTSLVGNLLDMSRLQAGALHLVADDLGFDEVVPKVLAGLGPRASRVLVDVPESLPRVHADGALLERVVANVVENALNYSPPESVVRVGAGSVGSRVELRVADQGGGIPTAKRAKMFEPFQRLGDSGNGAGVGLGLAVARGFVEVMGGEITVEDTPGGGLTMVLGFPAVRA